MQIRASFFLFSCKSEHHFQNQSQNHANQSIISISEPNKCKSEHYSMQIRVKLMRIKASFFLIFIANANQSIIKNQNQCKPGFILNFRAKTLCKSKHYFQIKAKVKANQNFMFSLGVITKINAKTNQWDSREFQFQSQINASQGIFNHR